MDSLRQVIRRRGPAFLAVLVTGWLLGGPNSATFAVAPPPQPTFATVSQPFGIAATPGRLLVTHCDPAGNSEVLSIDSTGGTGVFAALPKPVHCGEDYIAIAPAVPNPQDPAQNPKGLFPPPSPGGFPSNYAYVTQGDAIYQLTLTGQRSVFATIASCPTLGGITFDHVGTFGYRLIVVCSTGQVWLLNNAAQAQLIATVPTSGGTVAEGPDVAPGNGLAPFSGQLLVTVAASQGGGKIFAVSPAGAVTQVTTTQSPESIAFIPNTKCTFGLAPGQPVYFTAAFGSNTVDYLPLINPGGGFSFAGLGGSALVTTEDKGITLLSSVNGKIATSTFEPFITQLQGSAFVDCATPVLLQSFRNDFGINPGANGVVTVWIVQTPNFNPLTICVGNGVTADGRPCPAAADPTGKPPAYGVKGTEQSFAGCGSNLVSTGRGPALECKFVKSSLGITTPNYEGPLIINLFYVGGGGDGDAGGEN